MKNILKILILAIIFVANQANAQNDVFIQYDEAYMDKYQYKVENLSSQNFHIAYHIYTSASERIILNIAMNSYQNVSASMAKNASKLTEMDWNATLINEINNGLKNIYLVFNEEGNYQIYKVSTAVFVVENEDKLMYSGPYYSYTFDKKKTYGVAEDLQPGIYDIYDETIFMTNNGNSTMECLNQYNFIKIIKQTHPKGSFTMIANEDFTSLHKDEIFETCQSALYVDFVEGVGITEERTKNGRITLIGINEKPLRQYIMERCQIPTEYSTTTNNNSTSTQPIESGKPGLNFSTRSNENTEKSGGAASTNNTTNNTNNNNSTIIVNPTNTNGDVGEYELVFEMLGNNNRVTANTANTENTEKSPTATNGKQHIVDNGETLYSISKKYGTSVKVLQEINNLETTDILVTQVLIIKE